MGYVVKMPKLGLEMEQGTLLEWYIEEGGSVEEGEVIAEIESEKSIGEIEAREDGVLRSTDLEEGESVPPGTPIAVVADADEDIADLRSEFESGETGDGTDSAEPEGSASTDTSPESTAETDASERTPEAGPETSAEQVRASPRAERRAEELDVALTELDGTGPQGAITADDVKAAAESDGETATDATPATTEQVKASPRAKRRAEELDVDLTGVDGSGPQGAITADDVEAAAEDTPMEAIQSTASDAERVDADAGRYRTATLVVDGDEADTLIEATDLATRAFGVDASPLDVLLVASSATFEVCPEFNATFEDDTHQLHRRRDVATATVSEGELVTPVLESVGTRSFADLVETRHESTEEAIASGVSGGRATFAIALEGEGIEDIEEVVTPPTVAGLIANPSRRRAIPAENGVSLERCLSVTLAYDTRVLGDEDAEVFLGTLLDRIGNAPELLLRTYDGTNAQ